MRRVHGQFDKAQVSGKSTDAPSRLREGQCPKVESALEMSLFDKEAQEGTNTVELVVEKARQMFADFPELDVLEMFAFSNG